MKITKYENYSIMKKIQIFNEIKLCMNICE